MNTGAQKKPKAAVVLSGCGVFDGTEIHEAVITLLCLLKGGAEVSFFAPDIRQSDCINLLTDRIPRVRATCFPNRRELRGER